MSSWIFDCGLPKLEVGQGLMLTMLSENVTQQDLVGAVVVQIFGGQIFGNHLYTNYTPADLIYNPFGPDFTQEKATEILKCMRTSPSSIPSASVSLPAKECPSYFQLIQKDLEPWKESGITQEMIEWAKDAAFFRVVVLDSKLYIERYKQCFMNRAIFEVWGLLLFVEKFKGQIPDVEFMFACGDVPRMPRTGSAGVMFSFDSNHGHYDIPFPDWTFWGWCVYITLFSVLSFPFLSDVVLFPCG